jgi:hypothetical protein
LPSNGQPIPLLLGFVEAGDQTSSRRT